MSIIEPYTDEEPTRAAIDAIRGPLLLEFGSNTCGHCRAAQPHIAAAFPAHPRVLHIKVQDGRGRPLGRSFGVKLWPTLVFLKDGLEVARLVRPLEASPIALALSAIAGDSP